MLIEIHMIQNHSPSNLNRDDLGAPKTCYFGGTLRSRISSQCLKRSIRMSDEFKALLGGIRTRQLADLITKEIKEADGKRRAEKILALCGIKAKQTKRAAENEEGAQEKSKMLVYTTKEAVSKMATLLQQPAGKSDEALAKEFAKLIACSVNVPDMALSGRMLEPESSDVWNGLSTTIEAALQVAHAISTHDARPEVDYYVAKDDVPGADKGASFVAEALFASACFYKYFTINWEELVKNLNGNKELAAHTIGSFIRAAALVTPTGKQNSFAAHNPPDGILVEFRNTPISYANAFVKPAANGERDLVSQSIFQFGDYVHNMDVGYGNPEKVRRFWYSPNLQHRIQYREDQKDIDLTENNIKSLDELVKTSVKAVSGLEWQEVQKVVVNKG